MRKAVRVTSAAGGHLLVLAATGWLLTTSAAQAVPIVVQAEDFSARTAAIPDEDFGEGLQFWFVVDDESPGVMPAGGSINGATGPDGDYLQALTLAGQSDGSAQNIFNIPGPYVDFVVSLPFSGLYDLDVRIAGVALQSATVWAGISGVSPTALEGRFESDDFLRVQASGLGGLGTFAWHDSGLWVASAGTHTIRVGMYDSGAALDAVRIEYIPEPSTLAPVSLGLIVMAAHKRR